MVPDAEERYAEVEAPVRHEGRRLQDDGRSARHPPGPHPSQDEHRRAATAVERPQGRDEPRRPSAGPSARGRRLRHLAPSSTVHEARHHRPVAGRVAAGRTLRRPGRARPRVHRPVVARRSTSRSSRGPSRRSSPDLGASDRARRVSASRTMQPDGLAHSAHQSIAFGLPIRRRSASRPDVRVASFSHAPRRPNGLRSRDTATPPRWEAHCGTPPRRL